MSSLHNRKFGGLCILAFLVMVLASSCALFAKPKQTPAPTPPPPTPSPRQQPEEISEAPEVLEESTNFTPLKLDVVRQINQSGASIKQLQYYISNALLLEYEQDIERIEITERGEVQIRQIVATDFIIIHEETPGVLTNTYLDASGQAVLELCFDDENGENVLYFRNTPDTEQFSLLYNEVDETLKYGEETYTVRFNGGIPFLQIRLVAVNDFEDMSREIRGRTVVTY